MNITVIGAGAIGGHIAAKLAAAGESVKVVARGVHLKAIRERGLTLKEGEQNHRRACRSHRHYRRRRRRGPHRAGRSRRTSSPPIAADIASIVTSGDNGHDDAERHTMVVFPISMEGLHEGVRLESVDPGGIIASHLPVDAVIAAISYQAAEIESPGVIRHIEGHRLPLAEIDGQKDRAHSRLCPKCSQERASSRRR